MRVRTAAFQAAHHTRDARHPPASSATRLQPWMLPLAAPELLASPIHPRRVSLRDQLLFEVKSETPPRPGEMIKEAVQMAVWPAIPR